VLTANSDASVDQVIANLDTLARNAQKI